MRKQFVNAYKQIIRITSLKSIQKRLGFPENAKLLIIHADDFGMSASENAATIEAMENGMVNSASVMVPCPYFPEIADYSKTHPKTDIGIHLTLTGEWRSIRWKPILPSEEVASIVDSNGSLLHSKEEISENAIANEVGKEFRAQVNQAIKSGIDLTHIDSHMYTAFSNNEILKTYISLGKEFKLPVLLTYEMPLNVWLFKNAIVVDQLYCARPQDYKEGLGNYYKKVLNTIMPGLSVILVHIAFNNKEMQDLTGDQPNFGSAWRQSDFDFFTSDECRQLIQDNNIQLVTWREIRDKLIR